jgi:hypothetical protein
MNIINRGGTRSLIHTSCQANLSTIMIRLRTIIPNYPLCPAQLNQFVCSRDAYNFPAGARDRPRFPQLDVVTRMNLNYAFDHDAFLERMGEGTRHPENFDG